MSVNKQLTCIALSLAVTSTAGILQCAAAVHKPVKHVSATARSKARTRMSPQQARDAVRNARKAIAAKHFAEAGAYLVPAAETNNAEAETLLGDLYLRGLGIPRNFTKARALLNKAVAQNDADAMWKLASSNDNFGLAGDQIPLFKKAAAMGSRDAQFWLGAGYLIGGRMKRDYKKALSLLQKGAQQNHGDSERLLAFIYERGIGVVKDPVKAAALAQKATLHGCGRADYEIGIAYLRGIGGPRDTADAVRFMRMGAEVRGDDAQCFLAMMHRDGEGVSQDLSKAAQLFLLADLNGCYFAKFFLAENYFFGLGKFRKDNCKAEELYTELAQQGETSSARRLSRIALRYKNGKGVAIDYVKARALYEKALAFGDASGAGDLAWLVANGLGGSEDSGRSMQLYRRAASLGDENAKYNVALNLLEGSAVETDHAGARAMFEQCKGPDLASAKCFLAYMYENGLGCVRDKAKASSLMADAKRGGCADAEYEIGRINNHGWGVEANIPAARVWLNRAIADGNLHAANELANIECREHNEVRATQLFAQGANGGCPTANRNLARHYEYGEGVPKDMAKAKMYYAKAAELGNNKARKRLAELAAEHAANSSKK